MAVPPQIRSSEAVVPAAPAPRNLPEHCGESKAKPFEWTAESDEIFTAEWAEVLTGELQIENAFSPNATRRWIRFETNPIIM